MWTFLYKNGLVIYPMAHFEDHGAIPQGFRNGHPGSSHSESRSVTGVPKFDGDSNPSSLPPFS